MWKNVLGQDRIKSILSNSYLKGRIPHAYLFHGPEGTGKDASAVEFAKLINCDSPTDGEACDNCKSCRDIGSLKPPLIRFVTALPSGKNESDDKDPLLSLDKEDAEIYLSEIARKAEDKYHQIRIPGANDIRISSIRLIKDQASLTGYAGKKKIFLLSGADRMNQQSSNALLKILEEPPEDTLLILTTSRLNSLLPTIIGRCSLLRFDPLKDEDIQSFITTLDKGLKKEVAAFYSALAQGSVTNVRQILSEDYLELRETAIEFLAATVAKRYISLGRNIDKVISAKDKQRIRRFITLLTTWFRDVEIFNAGMASNIVNSDKSERIDRFSSNYSSDNYKILKLLEEAMNDVDRNIFPELLLTNLSSGIENNIASKAGS